MAQMMDRESIRSYLMLKLAWVHYLSWNAWWAGDGLVLAPAHGRAKTAIAAEGIVHDRQGEHENAAA